MTTANTSNKTLGQVFECLVQNQAICESRKGPIKTALKQYSVLLGYDDFHKCPFEAYAQNDEARNRLIRDRARRTTVSKKTRSNDLGQDAVRNC